MTPSAERAPAADEGARLGRVLTIPNALSLGRLLCVPVFLWLLFGRDNRVGAALLLGTLGATDWVDGYIARRFDQVSTVGKVLDPVADRVLLVVGIVAIVVDGSVPVVVAALAIFRELAVSVGVLVLAALGAHRIDVSWAGKCGTFALMTAFPLFLVANAPDVAGEEVLRALAWGCAVVGLGFSYWSLVAYLPAGRSALREGRAQPSAADRGNDGGGDLGGGTGPIGSAG